MKCCDLFTQMTSKGHKKVKSEVAPYLKMTFMVCTNHVTSFMLLSKSTRKKCLAALLVGLYILPAIWDLTELSVIPLMCPDIGQLQLHGQVGYCSDNSINKYSCMIGTLLECELLIENNLSQTRHLIPCSQ